MTSSMLSGERRWASLRRGGMTVLGKVAVPKPINLHSQRLENQGLEPDVEIVPKGTLSWGSRSSSSASNVRGSSSLSPNTDGSASSSSHLSARPSSGGSGTRPSTTDSDRSLEPTANAWGSNSRPSSASGTLTSNHTSLSAACPRSAETRPGSSQLSRFAEHSSENSGTWSAARITEKLGVSPAQNEEFSLSSRDFPTLGSERDKSVKNSELKDHSSHSGPTSSSGLVREKAERSVVDDVPVNANVKDGVVNSWRRDYPAFGEDGVRPSFEKWQGNLQPYPNAGIPYQHCDAWHGPTINNPQGGVLFRCPPAGPPFGKPVAPGVFSIEPFPYYCPHIPAAGLANPPPVPPPVAGPRGPHPKNGDAYRPYMPDAYCQPNMSIRPGFYPGPIPYEGYYSPPMGYHISNERDFPFMGMASGPPVYNSYPNQNPTEPANSQGRSGEYDSDGNALTTKQMESRCNPDTGGPSRVLLKQHEWDEEKEPLHCASPERSHAAEVINASLCEVGTCGKEMNPESSFFSGTATARQTAHAMQGRADFCNKGKITQDADGWQKKSLVADSPALSAAQLEVSSLRIGDHCISFEHHDKFGSQHLARLDRQSVQTLPDPSDSQAQCAKMEELTIQQTKQLQGEEEEWTRKQKAKALVKLDELNRHAQIVEGSTQRKSGTRYTIGSKREELQASDLASISGKSGAPDSAIMCNANVDCQISETSSYKVKKSPPLSSELPFLETQKNAVKEPALSDDPSVVLHQDVVSADGTSSGQIQDSIVSKQKRTGSKQKQNYPSNKTSDKRLVSTLPSDPKAKNDTMVNVRVPSGIVANEMGSTCGSGLPINSDALVDSSSNQKRKNFRNDKNKHKVEETSALEALPSAMAKEVLISRSSFETDQPRVLEFEIDQDAVQPASFSKDSNQNLNQRRHSPNEESHGRTNSQWKSQHSHRVLRNRESNRPAEKFHGSDAVTWAPVKPQNKTEIMDELSDNSKIEAVNPVKGDPLMNNYSKNKRVEIERYIPKPVVKEMAEHGNIQQVPLMNQITLIEMVGRADSGSQGLQVIQSTILAAGKDCSGIESKNVDGRQNKQGKAHGSWRQWGSTEATDVHDMQDRLSPNSKSDHTLRRSTGHQPGQKSEMSTVMGQIKHLRSICDPNGTDNSYSDDSAPLVSDAVIEDQIATGRGKRVPFRGHRSFGVNCDVDVKKNGQETEKIESHKSSFEPSQPNTGAAFKENQRFGERIISHWQPKSQPSNNERGNKPNKQNEGSEVGQVNRKDSAPCGGSSISAGCVKERNDHCAPTRPDQSVSNKNKAGEPPNLANQEAKRERTNPLPKGRSHSSNQAPVNPVEQAPASMDVRHDQHPSSSFHKNGNRNWFGGGHESRGDWMSQGQDNRHYSQSANQGRQGQNLHYEYHSVGPYDNSKSDNFERPRDRNHTGLRVRDRGQTHSR